MTVFSLCGWQPSRTLKWARVRIGFASTAIGGFWHSPTFYAVLRQGCPLRGVRRWPYSPAD